MMLDVLNLRRNEDAQCTQCTWRANGWCRHLGGDYLSVRLNNNTQYLRLHGNVITTHFMGVPTLTDFKEGAEDISATNETLSND